MYFVVVVVVVVVNSEGFRPEWYNSNLVSPVSVVLKGATGDFLQSPYCPVNCPEHLRSSGPGAVVCKTHMVYLYNDI